MITALDTNVLLDVLLDDPTHGNPSARALLKCHQEGALVVSGVVWAELGAVVRTDDQLSSLLGRLGARYEPLPVDAATTAGRMWRAYRERGGTRRRVVADFLVGAHALHCADRLLTRDRGFYRAYFDGLEVLEPVG